METVFKKGGMMKMKILIDCSFIYKHANNNYDSKSQISHAFQVTDSTSLFAQLSSRCILQHWI